MKIHLLSDTHNRHKEFTLPGGDLLIHSGDATGRGDFQSIINFLEWYGKQNYKYKVFVPGNHDFGFETDEQLYREECVSRGIILLINQSVEIECIKIWGSPVTPWFFDWAFNVNRGPDIKKYWDQIPEDTEILITHGPPHKILDSVPRGNEQVGCVDLFNRIIETKVKLHVFGHIHCMRGTHTFMDKLFVNAASVGENYLAVRGVPWKLIRTDDGKYEIEE